MYGDIKYLTHAKTEFLLRPKAWALDLGVWGSWTVRVYTLLI